MEFSNRFHVPASRNEAWAILMDIPRIAPCLPGTTLTEIVDAHMFKGTVSLRLGPMMFAFSGIATIVDRDDNVCTAIVNASGADTKGRGGAQAIVKFALTPLQHGTDVNVQTSMQLSGSVAQFGRASGIISSVAAQLIAEFERCLAVQLACSTVQGSAPQASPGRSLAIGLPAFVFGAVLRWMRQSIAAIFRRDGERA